MCIARTVPSLARSVHSLARTVPSLACTVLSLARTLPKSSDLWQRGTRRHANLYCRMGCDGGGRSVHYFFAQILKTTRYFFLF